MPIEKTPHGDIVITGDSIDAYRLLVLAKALKLKADTGLIPTRGVTAGLMLKMASEATGKAYKRGAYMEAHDDLMVLWDYHKGE